jgi:hypothetical protein
MAQPDGGRVSDETEFAVSTVAYDGTFGHLLDSTIGHPLDGSIGHLLDNWSSHLTLPHSVILSVSLTQTRGDCDGSAE